MEYLLLLNRSVPSIERVLNIPGYETLNNIQIVEVLPFVAGDVSDVSPPAGSAGLGIGLHFKPYAYDERENGCLQNIHSNIARCRE
jgi:hypothetical protein